VFGTTAAWTVALCAGAAAVAYTAWARFDEPAYDAQAEFFAKYKPSFSTPRNSWARAKYVYVLAFVVAYAVLCLTPEVFFAFMGW
jgi:hypothetical protein